MISDIYDVLSITVGHVFQITTQSTCDDFNDAYKLKYFEFLLHLIAALLKNRTSAWVLSCNLLHIFRTHFPKNTSKRLLLTFLISFYSLYSFLFELLAPG